MSGYSQAQKIIGEITDDLYPEIDVLFYQISTQRKSLPDVENLGNAFDIFDGLREEVQSLKKYELKLVFPGVERYFGEMNSPLPQNLRINELHELLRKKEDCIKEKIMELEVELEEVAGHTVLSELVSFFKENYFSKKDAFYKCIAKLQKRRTASANGDFVEEDSLPA